MAKEHQGSRERGLKSGPGHLLPVPRSARGSAPFKTSATIPSRAPVSVCVTRPLVSRLVLCSVSTSKGPHIPKSGTWQGGASRPVSNHAGLEEGLC